MVSDFYLRDSKTVNTKQFEFKLYNPPFLFRWFLRDAIFLSLFLSGLEPHGCAVELFCWLPLHPRIVRP